MLTRKPSFTTGNDFELNYGDVDSFKPRRQSRGHSERSSRGGCPSPAPSAMARSSTPRHRPREQFDNLGLRGQVLFAPTDKVAVTLTIDHTRQRLTVTLRWSRVSRRFAPNRLRADRGRSQIPAPSFNAFDWLTDVDTPLRSFQDLGGTAVIPTEGRAGRWPPRPPGATGTGIPRAIGTSSASR